MIKVIPFVYNDYDDLCANTYLLVDETNKCIVIDPSKKYDGIVNFIERNKYELSGILLTHAHFDHIRGVDILYNYKKCPIYIGFHDELHLKNPLTNLSGYTSENIVVESPVITVSDNESINILSESIICMETPFHTAGSLCYYLKQEKTVFSGDSLFKGSIGRDDFITSKPKLKNESIKKIMRLPDETKVYPGHGEKTTIGQERISNTFVKLL